MEDLRETAVFMVHAIKQFCFGFDTMNETADRHGDASPAKAFYLTAIYHYLAVFYLLDKGNRPLGGSFYEALRRHGLEHFLEPIREIMDTPLGRTTFGDTVRTFRNRMLVHTGYRDQDLDRIYRDVDMTDPRVQEGFRRLLIQAYHETRKLAFRVVEATGLPLEDFGIAVDSGPA